MHITVTNYATLRNGRTPRATARCWAVGSVSIQRLGMRVGTRARHGYVVSSLTLCLLVPAVGGAPDIQIPQQFSFAEDCGT